MSVSLEIYKKLGSFALDMRFDAGKGGVALLGASGSGKSMLLKCIAGVVRPDAGRIAINGKAVFDSENKVFISPQRRKTGYLFQNYALFPTMTVRQNILCGVPATLGQRERKMQADAVLDRLSLPELAQRYPHQLSGGQQQRVALARILASKPKILLLDEPFAALDSHLRWEMLGVVQEMMEAFAGTVLFVTHDRDEAYRLCPYISIIESGRVTAPVKREALFHNPRTVAAARLTGCKNIVPIERCGENRIAVPAWNCVFQIQQSLPREAHFLGVRAHAFHRHRGGTAEHQVRCKVIKIIPGPFSNMVLCRPEGGADTLCWETEKAVQIRIGEHLVLGVLPQDMLFLAQ